MPNTMIPGYDADHAAERALTTKAISQKPAQDTFTAYADALPRVEKKFAALARRAVKLGLEAPTFKVVREFTERRRRYSHDGRDLGTFTASLVEIAVDGPELGFAGWSFTAALDHLTGEPGDVVCRYMPVREPTDADRSREIPLSFLIGATNTCEHCGFVRSRKTTFVLDHEDGRRMQVGSTCIADFLGHGDPKALAARAAFLSFGARLADEFGGSYTFGGGIGAISKLDFVAMIDATTRCYGWTSRGKAYTEGKTATVDTMLNLFWSGKALARAERDDGFVKPGDREYDRAAAALAWAATLADTSNDFLRNLYVVCKVEGIRPKSEGILAALLVAFDRAESRKADDARRAATTATSAYVGEVKTRLRGLVLEVTFTKWIETMYGSSCIVKMIDADGNVFTWFASNPSDDVVKGATLTLDGTVKKHDEYKGTKSTTLTRCTVKAVA